MNDRPDPDAAGHDAGDARLDAELTALRDSLRADARRTSDAAADLADIKAGVTPVTALPHRRPAWVAAALVAAAAAVLIGVVVLTRDDQADTSVPATEPTTIATPDTTAPPSSTPETTDTTAATTTTQFPHTLVPLSGVTYVDSISYGTATDGWAIVEVEGGARELARTVPSGWVIADGPPNMAMLDHVHFADTQNGWLMGEGGWWSTHDGGATWNDLPIGPSEGSYSGLAIAGGWVLTLRIEEVPTQGYTVRVWRSPIGADDFRPTDAAWPKGAGGNDVTLTAAFDGTDVLVAENDRGGTTLRLHDDGTVSPWSTPAGGRGGDIFLSGPAAGGPVWMQSQTGAWGGDAEPQQVLAVAASGGTPFVDVAPPEPIDLRNPGVRLCGLSPLNATEAIAVMCDPQGARQYRTTDLGATWEKVGEVGNASGGEWSWSSSVSPSGVMALFATISAADGSSVTSEVWIITDPTSGWLKVLP